MKRGFVYTAGIFLTTAAGVLAQAPVGSAGAGNPGDIRGIRGPVEIPVAPDWSPWIWGSLGGLGAFVVVYMLIVWLRGRAAGARVLSAREWALEALQGARGHMESGSSREFAYAVSDAVRGFIEVRFQLPSTRQTTDEFLRTVAHRGAGLGPYRGVLTEFLGLCDLGKFGKWALDGDEMEAMHASAMALILVEAREDEATEATAPRDAAAVSGRREELQPVS
ncbi:MAG: hypothetical protein AAGD22_14555 [Verrucomicrobiota bacterium]